MTSGLSGGGVSSTGAFAPFASHSERLSSGKRSEIAYLRPPVQLIQQPYVKTGAELSKLIGAGKASDINVLGREGAVKDNPINELVDISWICQTQARSSLTGQ